VSTIGESTNLDEIAGEVEMKTVKAGIGGEKGVTQSEAEKLSEVAIFFTTFVKIYWFIGVALETNGTIKGTSFISPSLKDKEPSLNITSAISEDVAGNYRADTHSIALSRKIFKVDKLLGELRAIGDLYATDKISANIKFWDSSALSSLVGNAIPSKL